MGLPGVVRDGGDVGLSWLCHPQSSASPPPTFGAAPRPTQYSSACSNCCCFIVVVAIQMCPAKPAAVPPPPWASLSPPKPPLHELRVPIPSVPGGVGSTGAHIPIPGGHHTINPLSIGCDAGVDGRLLVVAADTRAGRHHPFSHTVADQRTPGVTLWGQNSLPRGSRAAALDPGSSLPTLTPLLTHAWGCRDPSRDATPSHPTPSPFPQHPSHSSPGPRMGSSPPRAPTLHVSFLRESVHIIFSVMVRSWRVRWLQSSLLITGRCTSCSRSGRFPLCVTVPHPAALQSVSAATSRSSRWNGSGCTCSFSSAFSSSCHREEGRGVRGRGDATHCWAPSCSPQDAAGGQRCGDGGQRCGDGWRRSDAAHGGMLRGMQRGLRGGPRGEGGWVGAVGAVGRGVGEPTWSSRRSSRLLWMLLPGWAICARTL